MKQQRNFPPRLPAPVHETAEIKSHFQDGNRKRKPGRRLSDPLCQCILESRSESHTCRQSFSAHPFLSVTIGPKCLQKCLSSCSLEVFARSVGRVGNSSGMRLPAATTTATSLLVVIAATSVGLATSGIVLPTTATVVAWKPL